VDKGLEGLILHLNQTPEIETYFSCIGDEAGDGYLCFGGSAYIPFITELIQEINRERAIWKQNHKHDCRGCRSMSLRLIADGCGPEPENAAFRWHYWDRDKAVRALKAAYDRVLVNLTNAEM
jgi:hypothetical protein